ncbi:hypothetical protein [Cryobacterium melibiosiphilum]|uniref:hypothetical protein n=1 Tax=Cryobacterium melibiosiphilum TaxID=995039 RepID=UPI0011C2412E|nr:hypothetical protein [Cryobacterium melibiosiphilum]
MDIALVVWAVSDRTPPTAVGPVSSSVEPTVTPTAFPTLSVSPEPVESPVSSVTTAVPPTRILTALNDLVAWRAATGPCPDTSASPEYTLDGGLTWTPTDATGPTDVTSLQSITVEDDGIASMVGLSGEGCNPEFIKTFIAGGNYRAYPDQLDDEWFVDPTDSTELHTPQGDASVPCTQAVVVAPQNSSDAAILCSDQSVYTTQDSGETWSSSIIFAGAVNLSVMADGYHVAILENAECAGVQLATLSLENSISSTSHCLVTDTSSSAGGGIGLSEADGALWVWVGDTIKKSLDGGATWEP